MFRARATWDRFAKPLFNSKPRPFCTNNNNNKTTKPTSNNSISVSENNAVESNVSNDYNQAYKQLDKLDFVTAAKMLFTDPPKKKKFGYCFAFFGISCRSYCFWVLYFSWGLSFFLAFRQTPLLHLYFDIYELRKRWNLGMGIVSWTNRRKVCEN